MKKNVVIREITEKETKTGSTYLVLSFSDKEGVYQGKIWNTKEAAFPFKRGNVVCISYEVKTYNGQDDIIIGDVKSGEGTPLDFIPCVENTQKMYEEIIEVIKELRPSLRELVEKIYEDYKEMLLTWPAAKSVHHDMKGGLLLHTYRMLSAAIGLDGVYPNIDMDMVYSGVLLHDIGKLQELSFDECGICEYTSRGTLMGHMPLGFALVYQYGQVLGTNEEDLNILLHAILSHQGLPEYGSCMIPCVPEAYIVHSLDMIDSRVFQYEKYIEDLNPGTQSQKAIKTLGGAHVYHRR